MVHGTVCDPGFLEAAKVTALQVGLPTAEGFERTIRAYRDLSPAGRDFVKNLIAEP